MTILATLIGGIAGFISFVCAVFVFDLSVLRALGLYSAVGTGLTLSLIAAALFWRGLMNRPLGFNVSIDDCAREKTCARIPISDSTYPR